MSRKLAVRNESLPSQAQIAALVQSIDEILRIAVDRENAQSLARSLRHALVRQIELMRCYAGSLRRNRAVRIVVPNPMSNRSREAGSGTSE